MKTTPKKTTLDVATAGPLLMLAAAIFFTVLNFLIKAMGPAYSPWHIGFFRFSGGIAILVLLFGRNGNPFKGHNTRLLIIRGCTGSVAFLSIVTAIRILPVSTAVVIFYAFPAFSAVFSYLIYGDRITLAEACCIVGVIVGVAVLFDFKGEGALFGQLMALSGACFAGITVTLIKALREKNGPVIIYLYFCTMGFLVSLPVFVTSPVMPASAMEWGLVVAISVTSVAAQLLMNQGLFFCKGWEGGILMSSEVIFTAIVGILFYGDPATWRFWTGGALIFGSAVVMNRFKARRMSSLQKSASGQ